jgi:hypothetical protein
MNVIEGVDYIIDFYAVLEVDRNAPPEDIRRKGNRLRGSYHSDKTGKLPDDLASDARGKFDLYSKAMGVLLDPEKRRLFDERLDSFPAHLVSTNGNAIVDVTRRRIDLDYLLSGKIKDISELQKRGKVMSQYDESGLDATRSAYTAMPDNEAIKAVYRLQLHAKLTYISIMEDLMWWQAGVQGDTGPTGLITHVDDYLERIDAEIKSVATEQIPKNMKQRLLAETSGLATALLLGDSSGQQTESGTGTDISTVVQKRMVENFSSRTEAIREYAREKQETLRELLELTDYEFLGERQGTAQMRIFLMNNDNTQVVAGFKRRSTKLRLLNAYWSGKTREELESYSRNKDTVLIKHDDKIPDFLMEVTFVAEKIANE